MRMSGGMVFFFRTGMNKLASLRRFRSQPAWNQFWISSFAGFSFSRTAMYCTPPPGRSKPGSMDPAAT